MTTLDLVLATVRDLPAIWWVGFAGLILWLWNLIEAKEAAKR